MRRAAADRARAGEARAGRPTAGRTGRRPAADVVDEQHLGVAPEDGQPADEQTELARSAGTDDRSGRSEAGRTGCRRAGRHRRHERIERPARPIALGANGLSPAVVVGLPERVRLPAGDGACGGGRRARASSAGRPSNRARRPPSSRRCGGRTRGRRTAGSGGRSPHRSRRRSGSLPRRESTTLRAVSGCRPQSDRRAAQRTGGRAGTAAAMSGPGSRSPSSAGRPPGSAGAPRPPRRRAPCPGRSVEPGVERLRADQQLDRHDPLDVLDDRPGVPGRDRAHRHVILLVGARRDRVDRRRMGQDLVLGDERRRRVLVDHHPRVEPRRGRQERRQTRRSAGRRRAARSAARRSSRARRRRSWRSRARARSARRGSCRR